jgi:hypothetical protein
MYVVVVFLCSYTAATAAATRFQTVSSFDSYVSTIALASPFDLFAIAGDTTQNQ